MLCRTELNRTRLLSPVSVLRGVADSSAHSVTPTALSPAPLMPIEIVRVSTVFKTQLYSWDSVESSVYPRDESKVA